jgi:branched-chain amino acid transport system substrate-binding protein
VASTARSRRRAATGLLVVLLASAACSGAGGVATTASTPTGDGSVVSRHAGEPWFLGAVPATGRMADPALEPIRLGLINQEQTPVGSYPEVRAAVQAAAAWVNAELGGVDGRPVEIIPCITRFDPEESRSCAQGLIDAGVVAFVGGVDVQSTAAFPVMEENGLVSIGGIPATLAQQRSPYAFFFSGGDSGALAAFMAHAAENGATKVALAYGQEVDSFAVAARDYGAAVGSSLGLAVELVPYPMVTGDYRPVLAQARDSGADAVMFLAATSACVPVMQAAGDVGLDAQLYLTGACAADSTIDAAGAAADGVLFNAEGRLDPDEVEGGIFQDVVDRYASEPAGGAGTVGFRGFMNLYSLLLDAGADHVDSATLADLAGAARDRPSFWGHPYTCDGSQVPGLPALCAPQQVLFRRAVPGGAVTEVAGWIETDQLFADALG